jgi:hypothetical protein
MANRNSDVPAQPRDMDRRDSADDRVRDDVERFRSVGDDDDEFEDVEDLDLEDDEEEGAF